MPASSLLSRLLYLLSQEGSSILQKNEGQWEFALEESRDGLSIHLDVEVGRFLDSSLIKADVQPRHVRLLIKVAVIRPQSESAKGLAGYPGHHKI